MTAAALLQLLREHELRGIRMFDRQRGDRPVVLHQVHGAPVGDPWHGHLRNFLQPGAPVERDRQLAPGIEQEPLRFFDALAVLDVRRRSDPEVDLARVVTDRNRTSEVPAVRPVGGAEAVLDLEDAPVGKGLLTARDRLGQIVRMGEARPRGRIDITVRHTGVLEPAPVVVRRIARTVGGPDDLRHCVGELPVALGARAAELGELLFGEQLGLLMDLLVLLPELDEDRNLGAQDLRVERFEHVVDRADLVAAEDVPLLFRECGQEDDRDEARPLALLDHLGDLEAVEVGHLDVEQDHREVVSVQQAAERLCAGARADELVPERLEDRLQREEVLGPIVDEEQ
jgi:hypothetical protein